MSKESQRINKITKLQFRATNRMHAFGAQPFVNATVLRNPTFPMDIPRFPKRFCNPYILFWPHRTRNFYAPTTRADAIL